VLFGDLWAELFTFDSRVFRSIAPLILKPGELTLEYTRGRRVRYIPPLRLFLFITIILFFLISIRVNPLLEENGDAAPADSVAISNVISSLQELPAGAASERTAQLRQELLDELGATLGVRDSVLAGIGDSILTDLSSDPAREETDTTTVEAGGIRAHATRSRVMGKDVTGSEHEIVRGAIKLAPKMVFLLLPLFAALLALMYIRMRLLFIEHLVFSLHCHSILFLGFAIAALSSLWYIWLAIPPLGGLYLLFAMKRVYQQRWPKTLLKHFMLTSAYNLIFVSVLILIMGSSAYLLELAERHPWILGWLVG